MNQASRILFLAIWLMLGIVLILLPWSELWETNYFLYQYPALGFLLKNHYIRGAVSGLGFMNILMSLETFRHRPQASASRS